VRPVLSGAEYENFLAEFAGVRTRDEYMNLQRRIEDIAAKKGITLHEVRLW
jgi:hypothetical protein